MFNLYPHPNYKQRYNSDVQFRLETTVVDDPGVCSPPLWRSNSPPDSPVRFTNPRALSPVSRAQAIARGQREMMEIVESMPDTSYELSLKDIVEQRREFTDVSIDETQSMEDGEHRLIRGGEDSQQRRKNSLKRQESCMNHNQRGFLINMFFPFSIRSKKKKKSSIRTKSSPTTELLGGDRRDWWKKLTDSGNRESLGVTSSSSGESTGRSGSSGSSGSSTGGSGNLRNNSDRIENVSSQGCWSLYLYKKRKS